MDENNNESYFQEKIKELESKLHLIADTNNDVKELILKIHKYLLNQKESNEKLMSMMKNYQIVESDIVKFNIGGRVFFTYKSTVTKRIKKPNSDDYYPPNLLEGLISGVCSVNIDENRACFIDRNPKHFAVILDYLRAENLNEFRETLPKDEITEKEILKEAEFYEVLGLKDLITSEIETSFLQTTFSSSILSHDQIRDLINLCGFPKYQKWKLLYRASKDGFSGANFHEKCDGKTHTLTIIKTPNGNIFGGFTEAPWSKKNDYENDPNALIFSLINKEKTPLVMKCFRPQYAIYCSESNGPNFGGI